MVYRMVLATCVCLSLLAGVARAGAALTGDADGSGVVDARDALAILQADVGLLPISRIYVQNADVNHDGRVTPVDALLILQYDAGIVSELP